MKKICSCVLLFFFSAFQLLAAPCGDVDSSGKVDIVDALIIAQYYVKLEVGSFNRAAADVDGDGNVNILDALMVAQYYVGLINSLKGCPSPPTTSKLIGWAATSQCGPNGTTGGGDGPPTVVVTNTSELRAALLLSSPAVIEVRGQMQGVRMKEGDGVKNKTLIGTNGAFISGGMRIDRGNNLIFKNIRFGEARVVNGDDNLADGFTVHNTTCVWFDHCEFMNSIDGNLDLVGGDGYMTSWVTVSWCKFWYEDDYAANINPNHRFSNLIVGNDDKPNPLPYITYHHNWWGDNVIERMPRGRWAWAHVFNNYYSTQGNNYGIGASVGIQYVVENNFFEPGFEDPVYFFNTDKGVAVKLSGNQMSGVLWKDTKATEAEIGTPFVPSDYYSYTLQTPEEAKASVIAGAGVQ